MNIPEISVILDDLEAGIISWEQALQQVTALPTAWQTAEWKERRAALIQETCAVCATAKGPFVLQHLTPTPSFKETCQAVKYQLRAQLLSQVNTQLTDEVVAAHIGLGDLRPACPYCSALSIRHRPTMHPPYVCAKCKPGAVGFEQPETLAYYPKQRTTDRATALAVAREYLVSVGTAALLREYFAQIQHDATVLSLRQTLAYRSLTNTATYCKSCAYKADRAHIQRKAW